MRDWEVAWTEKAAVRMFSWTPLCPAPPQPQGQISGGGGLCPAEGAPLGRSGFRETMQQAQVSRIWGKMILNSEFYAQANTSFKCEHKIKTLSAVLGCRNIPFKHPLRKNNSTMHSRKMENESKRKAWGSQNLVTKQQNFWWNLKSSLTEESGGEGEKGDREQSGIEVPSDFCLRGSGGPRRTAEAERSVGERVLEDLALLRKWRYWFCKTSLSVCSKLEEPREKLK